MDELIIGLANAWSSVGTEKFVLVVLFVVIYYMWKQHNSDVDRYIELLQKVITVAEQSNTTIKIMDVISETVERARDHARKTEE